MPGSGLPHLLRAVFENLPPHPLGDGLAIKKMRAFRNYIGYDADQKEAAMNKCKITVLKTLFYEDLAKEYGAEGLGLCPRHQVGDVFYGDYVKPEGFCDEAWKAIYQYVFALAHGAGKNDGLFYFHTWIRKPGIAICTCNDGLRPVVFKVEQTDEPSVRGYTPLVRS